MKILRDELYSYYIENNNNIYDTAKHFGCSKSKITSHLQKYGIKKDLSLSVRNIKKSFMEKYGVDNPSKLQVVKDKMKTTNLERYNGVAPACSPLVQAKARQTNLGRYGVEHPSQNEEIKQKQADTNFNKYGVSTYLVHSSARQKMAEKFREHIPESSIEILNDEKLFKNFVDNFEPQNAKQMAKELGVSISYIWHRAHEFNYDFFVGTNSSAYEDEIKNIFDFVELEKSNSEIQPLEIDLYSKKHKFGIEFNGNYWHSEIYKSPKYHQMKSLIAEKNGIFIYHIFEHEWNDLDKRQKIISQVSNILQNNKIKIFARKCTVSEISTKEKSLFLKNNHIQGNDSASVKLGLYYNNELVSVMTFCKPRFNKNYDWELSRYCCLAGTNVVGGASRLFKQFVDNYLKVNETIISYSDIGKTKGEIYRTLGFSLQGVSSPNYVWCNFSKRIIKSRYQCQMKDEVKIMKENGFVKLYDCGSKVWLYEKTYNTIGGEIFG